MGGKVESVRAKSIGLSRPMGINDWKRVVGSCSVECTDGIIAWVTARASGIIVPRESIEVDENEIIRFASITEQAVAVIKGSSYEM